MGKAGILYVLAFASGEAAEAIIKHAALSMWHDRHGDGRQLRARLSGNQRNALHEHPGNLGESHSAILARRVQNRINKFKSSTSFRVASLQSGRK